MTDTASTTTVAVTPAVKPAYQTTEAWFLFATGVLGAAVTAHLIGPDSQIAQLVGMLLTLVSGVVHSWSRTSIKNAAVQS